MLGWIPVGLSTGECVVDICTVVRDCAVVPFLHTYWVKKKSLERRWSHNVHKRVLNNYWLYKHPHYSSFTWKGWCSEWWLGRRRWRIQWSTTDGHKLGLQHLSKRMEEDTVYRVSATSEGMLCINIVITDHIEAAPPTLSFRREGPGRKEPPPPLPSGRRDQEGTRPTGRLKFEHLRWLIYTIILYNVQQN